MLVIIVILFVWGPRKLPQWVRSIGLARKEIEKAYKETSSPTRDASSLTPPAPDTDPLIETAKRLGIPTEGKTREQISDDIVKAKTSAN